MRIKLQQIISFVNDELDLDINRNTRMREYVEARCLYYKLAREHTTYGLEKIGKTMRKNHATVMHALSNVWDHALSSNHHIHKAYVKFGKMVEQQKEELEEEVKKFDPSIKPVYNNSVDREEYLRLRKELHKARKNNKRFTDLINQLDTDRKKEELFLRLEATVNMLKGAVYR